MYTYEDVSAGVTDIFFVTHLEEISNLNSMTGTIFAMLHAITPAKSNGIKAGLNCNMVLNELEDITL